METKKIITPVDKIEVELKSFITGREKRKLKGAYLRGMKMEVGSGGNAKTEQVDFEKVTNDSEDLTIETIVVSVASQKQNIKFSNTSKETFSSIVDAILGMKSKDYEFVIAEINKVTSDNSFLEQSQTENGITEQAS